MNIRIAYHIDEAARLSGIGRTKLYQAIREGRLKAKKIGTRTLITAEALQAFVAALPELSADR